MNNIPILMTFEKRYAGLLYHKYLSGQSLEEIMLWLYVNHIVLEISEISQIIDELNTINNIW